MDKLKISTAQFENHSGDKNYNLSVIENLTRKAAEDNSKVIAFHECCITGYTFARRLSKSQLLDLAEFVPEGESTERLIQIAAKYDMVILAGLFEKDEENNIYNTYICVDKEGLVVKYRKLHPFISPYLKAGNEYCVFDLYGWKCGILICYDNNIIENVRATKLKGADVIFMPHVTMCTPSTRPGAGFVDPKLWENRKNDPTSLRIEFDGMKGRQWLMKWLPARAYDNAVYAVFSNPIGMDDDQLKNGCSMIIDPFGDILAECRNLGDDVVSSVLVPDKLTKAGGYRYIRARRPELYRDILCKEHIPNQKISWL
ncbi:MAG: nitrilase family protein [Dysgonamonadaceae bacterium]|jgi:predicted amidohydrolase|nr:nitrilase family protein [Dysgonamonadaceae bacterium]